MRALHHLSSKYSLFQQWKDYNSITIEILFSPTRTHFKKGMEASIYSKNRPIGPKGAQILIGRGDRRWSAVNWVRSEVNQAVWVCHLSLEAPPQHLSAHPTHPEWTTQHNSPHEGERCPPNPSELTEELRGTETDSSIKGKFPKKSRRSIETDFSQIGLESTDLETWICSII